MLFGYENIVSDFKKLADEKRLFHAYLFFGEQGVGKFLFAKCLANYIENGVFEETDKILRETLIIDLSSAIQSSEEGRESIGIDSVREIEKFLYQRPVFSPYRIVILRDAEWLTDYAQNALLKILEEPPNNGIVIAVSKDCGVFLPTVLSRFSRVFFGVLPERSILDFLDKCDIISKEDKIDIAKRAFGRIGRAKKLLDQSEKQETSKKLADKAVSIKMKDEKFAGGLVDQILEEESKDPEFLMSFFEELTPLLSDKFSLKFPEQLRDIYQTFFSINSLNVNKRIQIKKILWTIKSLQSS